MTWLLAGTLGARAAAPDGQYVREWLVAGPVSVEAAIIAQVAATLPVNLFRPAEGRRFDLPNGEQITWSRYTAPGSIVNLIHALGPHDNVSALACATIHAEQAGEVRFRVGSDDQIAILLNRQIVHRYDHPRPLRPDEDEFTATLRAGDNECLAIVGQGTGNWGFALRLLSGHETRPPPLTWDVVDVLEQTRELYSPHWRYCVGDEAEYAKAELDDSPWQPLSPTGEAAGIRDAPVIWFRCPVWVRPSLVGLPCSLRARLRGRLEVYLDGRRTATLGELTLPSGAGADLSYTPSVPFSFSAAHQILAVRLQRPPELAGQDRLDFRLAVSAVTQAGAEYDADAIGRTAAAAAEIRRLRQELADSSRHEVLWLNRWIIMATLGLFLVFHMALLYYYPRRLANRHFCVTLFLTLAAMTVLSVQEATEGAPYNRALYWVFIGAVPICLLSGLALVHALWCGRVPRRKLIAWAALGAVLYLTGLVQSDRRIAFAILPLMMLEYVRVYLTRALGKVSGAWIHGVGLLCFAAAEAISAVEHFTSAPPPGVDVPYCWVYGFVLWLACVSVDIGREFAGAVRKLEDLTATLDSRVEQVTRQLETSILAQARLETLRYQLNPHFLYNALNSIEAISREEPTHIPETVWALSDCLRYALQPKKGGLATLQQELDQVASYLRVEKNAFRRATSRGNRCCRGCAAGVRARVLLAVAGGERHQVWHAQQRDALACRDPRRPPRRGTRGGGPQHRQLVVRCRRRSERPHRIGESAEPAGTLVRRPLWAYHPRSGGLGLGPRPDSAHRRRTWGPDRGRGGVTALRPGRSMDRPVAYFRLASREPARAVVVTLAMAVPWQAGTACKR